MTTFDEMLEKAAELGREAGQDAAEWWEQDCIPAIRPGEFGADASEEIARRVLDGINEGDPKVMDSLPYPDLSGQWAGDMTPVTLWEECGGTYGDIAFWPNGPELLSELCQAWEDASAEAVQDAVRSACWNLLHEATELELCIDCVQLIANGGGDTVKPSWHPDVCPEDHWLSPNESAAFCASSHEAHGAALAANWPAPWHIELNCPEECEGSFSWSACDGCGSRLGGDRHPGLAWKADR